MKVTNPININLKDFFLKGQFDHIETGQTKELILKTFPDPDDDSDMGSDLSIWRYGCLEFHFDSDRLYLIWCDNLPYLKNSKSIKYNKWIVKNLSELTLAKVQEILNAEQANYSVKFDEKLRNVIIKIRLSRVNLWFENLSEEYDDNINEYKLIAFGKSDHEYDNFDRSF